MEKGKGKTNSVSDTIDAVIPVYSTDKKENWVLIWARAIATDLEGKTDTGYRGDHGNLAY